ncbi:MAG TPA: cobalamin-binding protein [bacterium]|nr:cobalamin-binding protein [bacterium]
MRIASLLPSATEMVCALGLADELVAISHDCDYPQQIAGTPVLSQAIVTSTLPSGEIEARIRREVHRGNSVYHLDAEQLADLRPELILTQELCSVCAPSYTLVKQAAKVLDADTKIVSLEPLGLVDILDNLLLVGELTGRRAQADTIVWDLRERIDRVRDAFAGLPKPRVVCIEWLEPLYVAGHWIPEMVDIAGGIDLLGRTRAPSYMVSWEDVVAAEPEILVVMPCGFDIARTREEAHLLTDRPGWQRLPAVQGKQVYLTDATSYLNRPGPRIVTGLEILAAILHPEVFDISLPPDAFEQL